MQRSSQNKGTNVSFREKFLAKLLPCLVKSESMKENNFTADKGRKGPAAGNRDVARGLDGRKWKFKSSLNVVEASNPLSLSLCVCVSQSDWSFSHSPSVFFFPPLNSSPVLSLIVKSLWSLNGLFAPTDFRFVTSIKVGHFVRWKMSFREHVLGGEKRKRSEKEREKERKAKMFVEWPPRMMDSQEPHFFSCRDKPFYFTLFHPLRPHTSFCSRIWFVTPAFIWYAHQRDLHFLTLQFCYLWATV